MKQRYTWRPSKIWIKVRKFVQYLTLLIFLALFIVSQNRNAPGDLVNLFVRLDPLLTISHLLSSRIFIFASTISLITLLLTLVFGRAWCGWLCPLGTVLDLFSLNRWRSSAAVSPSEGWRRMKYFLLLTILVAALFGNLSLLILDPITILLRTLSTSIWPALDQVITAVESTLYQIPILAKPVSTYLSQTGIDV
jgi:polyferredoxin